MSNTYIIDKWDETTNATQIESNSRPLDPDWTVMTSNPISFASHTYPAGDYWKYKVMKMQAVRDNKLPKEAIQWGDFVLLSIANTISVFLIQVCTPILFYTEGNYIFNKNNVNYDSFNRTNAAGSLSYPFG